MYKRISCILTAVLFCVIMAIPASAAVAPTARVVSNENVSMDCADSANILKDANWNFEKEEEFYWRLVNTIDGMQSAYYYVMAITDENPHEGKYSLMLDGVGGWSNIIVPINVKKNTDYTFSMWVNAKEGLGGMKNTVYKIGQVASKDITKIQPSEWFTGDVGFEYDGKWHQIGITVNSGDNEMLALIISDGGGTLFFDELRFFETKNPNGKAATEPSNLKKVIQKVEEEKKANSSKSSSNQAASSKSSSSQSNSSKSSSSQDSQSTSTENSSLNQGSAIEESSAAQNDSDPSSALPADNSSDSKNTNTANPLIIVIIIAAVVLAGGGAALWYFKFRK